MCLTASCFNPSLIQTSVSPYNASDHLGCTLIACSNQCLASSYRLSFSRLQARLKIEGKCFSLILRA